MATSPNKKFVLIDSHNLIHRAYHAFPAELRSTDGVQVNAAYGFAVLLIRVLEQIKPQYLACAFDLEKPTWRHAEMMVYKKNRKEMESELSSQIPLVKEIVEALNIPKLEFEGFEADDIVGTISEWAENGRWKDKDLDLIIVTGDRDILQLAGDNTRVWMPKGSFKDMQMYKPEDVLRKYGFGPEAIPEYKALVGDASDNIPGVAGIGEVSGTKLVQKYGSLEEVFKNIDEIEDRVKKKLMGQEEIAYLSRKVATIVKDVPLDVELESCRLSDFELDKAVELFTKLEFRTLISKIYKLKDIDGGLVKKPVAKIPINQQTMSFGDEGEAKSAEQSKYTDLVIKDGEVNDLNSLLSADVEVFMAYYDDYFYLFSEGKEIVKITQDLSLELFQAATKAKKPLFGFGLKSFYKKVLDKSADKNLETPYNILDLQSLAYLVSGDGRKFTFDSVIFDYLREDIAHETISQDDEAAKAVLVRMPVLTQKILDKLKDMSFKGKYIWDDLKGYELPGFLPNNPISRLFYFIENPTVFVLAEIERQGVKVDKAGLSKKRGEFQDKLKAIEKEIYASVGHEFNISSPIQLSEVLFKELNLPKTRRTKTAYSTDEESLRSLEQVHDLPGLILKYREIAKLLSTYIEGLSKVIPADERIRTTYNSFGSSTGRLSSIDPNLQNIPIRTEQGQEVRSLFVSESGNLLLKADYSQIELRVLAHQANEKSLQKAFDAKRDIHTETASRIFDKQMDDVTANERRVGKTVNFGIVYGQTAFGLSRQLDIPNEEAAKYIASYFEAFPDVEGFMTSTIDFVKQNNYVETIFGRRRYIYNINSANRNMQLAAQREAINMPIQGAATGDIMKLTMVKISELIRDKYRDKIKMIMQVHDELVFEVIGEELSDKALDGKGLKISALSDALGNFVKDMAKIMSGVVDLKVNLDVDVAIGRNWSDLTPILLG